MSTLLGFTGEPFDALAFAAPPSALPAVIEPPPVAPPPLAPPPGAGARVRSAARQLRLSVTLAHAQSLRAHTALQRKLLRMSFDDQRQGPSFRTYGPVSSGSPDSPAPVRVTTEAQFKPLARTAVRDLDAGALDRLARGDVAGTFGPAYDQGEANAYVRTNRSCLLSVADLSARGGSRGRGRLTARTGPLGTGPLPAADGESAARAIIAAVTEAAQVAALSFGLHLCMADATLTGRCPGLPPTAPRADLGPVPAPVSRPVELRVDISAVELVPRPFLKADAEVLVDGAPIGFIRDVTVAVVERPGVPVGPGPGGAVPRWLGRRGAFGDQAMLSEFHLAQCCRGDQGIAFGPEFARYTGRKATRPPDGGLLLVDRMMELNGKRGMLDSGSYRTEYDSHADSWYYQDTANASMPNCIYMETSLQSALLLGYYLGPTLAMPDENISLRNLGGTATVLREVDLRDKTIAENAELLSTSLVPGSSLQSFSYALSADGAPYYRGETLFGYFSDAAMANQTGLDAGRYVPTWLEAAVGSGSAPPRTRLIDVAARRADPSAALVSRRHLALLDEVRVVDGGGKFGRGYLWSARAIDPDDWVFGRHFHYDPVIPGSFGVEAVLHAMQEWLLDSGYGDGLRSAGFVLPAGLPFTWKYRGQFLPTDREFTLEVHIKSVERRPGRVRVVGEASLWKPGLRIYHLTDAAVELREEGAPPWD